MNKALRKQLEEASSLLTRAKEIISSIAEEEQDKFDNLSEGLQATENNQKLEAIAELLFEADSDLDDIINAIDEAINY
jgi:transcriptional accessory protein Tex/SPT6